MEGEREETEGMSRNDRRDEKSTNRGKLESVLTGSGCKLEWAIIDRKFREREKGENEKEEKLESSRDLLLLIRVIIPPSGAHILTHTERIERRSQFSWV